MVIYTAAITFVGDREEQPWVASFTTKKGAEEFCLKARAILEKHGEESIQVSIDSGYVDDMVYLDFLDDALSDDREDDQE